MLVFDSVSESILSISLQTGQSELEGAQVVVWDLSDQRDEDLVA